MIRGMHHLALIGSDRDRTLAFYAALGFSVKADYPRPERNDEVIMLSNGSVTLEVFISRGHPTRPSSPEAYGLRHLALVCDDAETARKMLVERGYCPEEIRIDAFNQRKMFFVKDPDGTPIEIHE